MKVSSLYHEGSSLVHQLSPISKMAYIVAALLIPFILSDLKISLICAFISLLLLASAGAVKKVVPLIGLSGLVLVTTVLIQGFFNQENETLIFTVGAFGFYKEGFYFAMGICVRVLNILCAFALLVLTTKPSDLVNALVQKGLSPRIGYVLLSVLQIIPQMMSTMETITDAQRARGMETEGKLSVRMRAFLPLLGPVVMNALTSTKERSLALEVRGFNAKGKKTFLYEPVKSRFDLPFVTFLLLAVLGAILWRVF